MSIDRFGCLCLYIGLLLIWIHCMWRQTIKHTYNVSGFYSGLERESYMTNLTGWRTSETIYVLSWPQARWTLCHYRDYSIQFRTYHTRYPRAGQRHVHFTSIRRVGCASCHVIIPPTRAVLALGLEGGSLASGGAPHGQTAHREAAQPRILRQTLLGSPPTQGRSNP